MPSLIVYLLKLSLSLSLIHLFYYLVLRKLTFYMLNRWYLLGYSALCLFIPLINVSGLINKADESITVVKYIPSVQSLPVNYLPVATYQPMSMQDTFNITLWHVIITIIAAGAFIMLARLIWQILSLKKLKANAVFIGDSAIPVYHIDDPNVMPFSFGNAIYLNRTLHTETELEEIITHEYVHVKQKHSIDIMFAELLCIINWYNPAAWFIRHSIKQNLEYIADDKVIRSGLDIKTYQYHLLKVAGLPQYAITNQFSFSSLKKRIIMMNSNRSAKINIVRFLFILPLLSITLLAFRDNEKEIEAIKSAPVLKAVERTLSKPVFADTTSKQETDTTVAGDKFTLSADSVTFNPNTGAKISMGHAVYKDSYLHVEANHIYFNGKLNNVKNAMVQIDGHPATLQNIPGKVSTITILGLPNSEKIYGEKAKHGAVIVETIDVYSYPKQINTTEAGKQFQALNNTIDGVIREHVNKQRALMGSDEDWAALKAKIILKVPAIAEDILMKRQINFFAMYGQWTSYCNAVSAYLDKYSAKAGRYDLNGFAANVLWGGGDAKSMDKAVEWSNRCLEGGKIKDTGCMYTYAHLLYKTGKTKEAIAVITEAGEINGFKNPVFAQALNKMQKGEL